jgi:hypothetical protein
MKKILMVALLLAAGLGAFAQEPYSIRTAAKAEAAAKVKEEATANRIDAKFGYKDIKLESHESEVIKRIKCKKVTDNSLPGAVVYAITDPAYLSIGTCETQHVFLRFFKNKLTEIAIVAAGKGPSRCILKALTENYGPETSTFGWDYTVSNVTRQNNWNGNKSFVYYSEDDTFTATKISIGSVSLIKTYREYRKTLEASNKDGL